MMLKSSSGGFVSAVNGRSLRFRYRAEWRFYVKGFLGRSTASNGLENSA